MKTRDKLNDKPNDGQLSDEQSREIAETIREELARRRLSRQALAEQAKLKADPVGDHFQGGAFCSDEFDGDESRIIDWTKR